MELQLARPPASVGTPDGEVGQGGGEDLEDTFLHRLAEQLAVGLESGEPAPHHVGADAGPVSLLAVVAGKLLIQQSKASVVVDGVGQPLDKLGHPAQEMAQELVLVVGAVVGEGKDLLEAAEDGVDGEGRHTRRLPAGPVIHQVPVVVEGSGHVVEVLQVGTAGEQEAKRLLHRRVFQQFVDVGLPPGLEGDLGGDLVEHLDARGKARLHGMLVQDALGEGMEGADGGPVEHDQGLSAVRTAGPGPFLQLAPDAIEELTGGLLGEGDGGDAISRDPRLDQRHEAGDQARRLARTGSRFEEQGPVEVLGDGPAGLVVRRRHRGPPARPGRHRRPTAGRTACVPTPGGGQQG